MVGASLAQPEKAAVADAVAAVSLDAMLGVVLANMAILASVKHQHHHQGVSSALSLEGVNHIVPSSHEAILQAVGFPLSRPGLRQGMPTDLVDVISQCCCALDWALQRLCRRLEQEAAAASCQHARCSSSSGSSCSTAGAGTESGNNSKDSTAPGMSPAGQPDTAATASSRSGGGVASFHNMRLLPLLPALLSELVALQPRSDVLNRVLTTSAKCLSVGVNLEHAARTQQSSQPGSCTPPIGSSIVQGLFKACLEVFVPVQQDLAAPNCSPSDGSSDCQAGAAGSSVAADCDPIILLMAQDLGGSVFQLLAGCMEALNRQHDEWWWVGWLW
jgi:hypothetical protein